MREKNYEDIQEMKRQQEFDDSDIGDIPGKREFIALVAERARFSQKDVRIILDVIIDIFKDAIRYKREIFIGGLGMLYYQKIPARKASGLFAGTNETMPETERVIFRLARTLRQIRKDTH